MVLKLYYLSASPPARAALLGIRNLGLSVELVDVDLFKQENLTPEFKRINPAHQVPVLDDDGFILSESRAILGYLVNRYQSGSTLYPTDARMRAVVDQRLYFDTTVFQRNCIAIVSLCTSGYILVIFNFNCHFRLQLFNQILFRFQKM